MSIGTAAAIAVGVGAAGSLASSAIGAHAASSAADKQQQSAQTAIDEQRRQFDITQQNMQPWLQAGTGALSQLTAGTQPGGAYVTPFGETYTQPSPFTAPTLDNTNDPGYAFRLQQGEQALKRGAAAGGGAFSGGMLAALTRYGQDYASNEYGTVFNRALQTYNTNANDALQGYLTRYNAYNTDQTNQYNRLASLAGAGQTAANNLGTLGAQNAGAIGNLLTSQGNSAAAGTLGSASAWNQGLSGLTGAANTGLNAYQNGQILDALTGGAYSLRKTGWDPNFGRGNDIGGYSN